MTTQSSIQQVRDEGWCCIDDVISPDVLQQCFYDAYRILTTCGVIAPSYPHNMSWQLRALELLEDVIDPARKESILDEQFYIRPAVINDAQTFAPSLADPRIEAVVNSLLGPGARVMFTTLFVHEPGTVRGPWHAGMAFNPDYAAHYPAPYENAAMHLTLHVLSSDFTTENGGILIVPGSHRRTRNPGFDPKERRCGIESGEFAITAKAGSVILTDSRLWRAIGPNPSDFPRVSVVAEFAPSPDKLPARVATAKVPAMSQALFDRLPAAVRPLFRHWVRS